MWNSTRKGELMAVYPLFFELGMAVGLPDEVFKQAVLGQYGLAREQGDARWIRRAQQAALDYLPVSWVGSNLSNMNPRDRSVQWHRGRVDNEVFFSENRSQDYRLREGPPIERRVEMVGGGDSSGTDEDVPPHQFMIDPVAASVEIASVATRKVVVAATVKAPPVGVLSRSTREVFGHDPIPTQCFYGRGWTPANMERSVAHTGGSSAGTGGRSSGVVSMEFTSQRDGGTGSRQPRASDRKSEYGRRGSGYSGAGGHSGARLSRESTSHKDGGPRLDRSRAPDRNRHYVRRGSDYSGPRGVSVAGKQATHLTKSREDPDITQEGYLYRRPCLADGHREQGRRPVKRPRSHTDPGPAKKRHRSLCPMADCEHSATKIKKHVYASHLPAIFKDFETPELLRDVGFQERRLEGLQRLSELVMGPGKDIDAAVQFVNTYADLVSSNITTESAAAMIALCEHSSWPVPNSFSVAPLNSPACLLHWRPLAFLMDQLSRRSRERIMAQFADERVGGEESVMESEMSPVVTQAAEESTAVLETLAGVPPADERPMDKVAPAEGLPREEPLVRLETIKEETLDLEAIPMSNTAMEVDVEVEMVHTKSPQPGEVVRDLEGESLSLPPPQVDTVAASKPTPMAYAEVLAKPAPLPAKIRVSSPKVSGVSAFDSHCHIDRTCQALGIMLSGSSVTELLTVLKPIPPKYEVQVAGGVAVFCDPDKFYHVQVPTVDGWYAAVGVHPKKVHQLNDQRWKLMEQWLEHPKVVALGEVGLDYSVHQDLWEKQETTLIEVLKLCRPQKVLVLHIRGSVGDKLASRPHRKALEIVKAACSPEQPIHLHCFTGGLDELRLWQKAFPGAYFGFTGNICRINKKQLEALRGVPKDRILVETDSPYLPVNRDVQINTPAFIGDVASQLAVFLRIPVTDVLIITERNGRRLYGARR